jgi:hypothetical protein
MTRRSRHCDRENLEFRSDAEAYQSLAKSLMEDIARDRATITALTVLAQREHSDSPPKSQRQSIPDPPVFDGTRAKLRPFLAQLRLKVAGDSRRFPDPQHQLRCASEALKASRWIMCSH